MAKKAKKKQIKKATSKKKTTTKKKTTKKATAKKTVKKTVNKKKVAKKVTKKKVVKTTASKKKTAPKKSAVKKKAPSKKATVTQPKRAARVVQTQIANERVVEYKLFVEDSVRNLEDQVNYSISKGWAPVGGVVLQSSGLFMQTMVRKSV